MMWSVHSALAQVREIHRHVVEKQRFKGYSGRARALAGTLALVVGLVLSRFPERSDSVTLVAWTLVAVLGVLINYGAVLVWYLREPNENRGLDRLRPAAEALPTLLVGALLTFVFWRTHLDNMMPPIWMLLFGLANWNSRRSLPSGAGWVGVYYLVSGLVVSLVPAWRGLQNPWPMTLVFFFGEWVGAVLFHCCDRPLRTWPTLFGLRPLASRHE
ncbi:MAG: hypothetical protein SFV32_08830 [Opitutaceae bacterium]|nr:hypothetical protein [Opitutaceae bacterium]